MQKSAVEAHMQRIKALPVVGRAEERSLVGKTTRLSKDARHRLILANLHNVAEIAGSFEGFGLPLQDLISEGYTGLIDAAENYFPLLNSRFRAYACRRIAESMRDHIRKTRRISAMPIQRDKLKTMSRATKSLTFALGREPREAEVAEHLGFKPRNAYRHLEFLSLNDPALRRELDQLPDNNAPYQNMDNADVSAVLAEGLGRLSKKEQDILTLRFGLGRKRPLTFEEVSKKLKITGERVRQLHSVALRKLRYSWSEEAPHEPVRPSYTEYFTPQPVITRIRYSARERDAVLRLYEPTARVRDIAARTGITPPKVTIILDNARLPRMGWGGIPIPPGKIEKIIQEYQSQKEAAPENEPKLKSIAEACEVTLASTRKYIKEYKLQQENSRRMNVVDLSSLYPYESLAIKNYNNCNGDAQRLTSLVMKKLPREGRIRRCVLYEMILKTIDRYNLAVKPKQN